MYDYTPFDGDGRRKIEPINPRAGTRPMAVTNASARRLIDSFNKTGNTAHSGAGSMLWIVEAWCKHHGHPYEVLEQTIDGQVVGYFVQST